MFLVIVWGTYLLLVGHFTCRFIVVIDHGDIITMAYQLSLMFFTHNIQSSSFPSLHTFIVLNSIVHEIRAVQNRKCKKRWTCGMLYQAVSVVVDKMLIFQYYSVVSDVWFCSYLTQEKYDWLLRTVIYTFFNTIEFHKGINYEYLWSDINKKIYILLFML